MKYDAKAIEEMIEAYLPEETGHQKTVLAAMNYAVKAGGKRLHHHDHHADEVFTSWGKETAKKFADADMEQILKTLADNADEYGIILRAKGIVPNTDGEWIHFDLTPGEYEIRKGAADYTGKLCVIGSNLKEDKLAELFGVA